ncbi:hypothetical protein [Flavobacterium lipolyticum]|uniref:Lipoprotein n=1 Tax=Flavobacterium lipolyticum TaxID=2893754 RepID=A0ABS8LXN8_9FLAO|nr:hypothetical protein [Flavobacterium sp. F-126]MCC9016703.1 hypothetical protein [Flavobacterium sp. F-126]
MMRFFSLYISIFGFGLLISCSVLPDSTTILTREVIKEGVGMHDLNIALTNQLFTERKLRLDSFIQENCIPAIIENYQKRIPDSVNYKKEFPNIVMGILPVIYQKKDSLQNVLNIQQQEIIGQLNNSFGNYTEATASLQDLIDSNIRLKNAKENASNSIFKLITKDKLDVKKIEESIEKVLKK